MEQRKGHQKWGGEAVRDLERLWWLCEDVAAVALPSPCTWR